MRVLIAEDDRVSRELLEGILLKAGHEVLVASDGVEALRILTGDDAPRLAVVDWMMPEVDGLEVCRRVRERDASSYVYLILLTARTHLEDMVRGLDAGADDYVTKPYEPQELRCRVRAGERIVSLQSALTAKVSELEGALAHVKQLQRLLPVCMFCKRIRDDEDIWHELEGYLREHADVMVTHAICQSCMEKHYGELAGDEE